MSDWVFTIHEPGRSPRRVPIQRDLGLGRGEECECTLRDQAASTWHAIVKDIEGRLALIDLGSTNRTRVRGGPVLGRGDHVFLKPGVELLIGRTVLLVEKVVPEVEGTLRIDSSVGPEAWDESGVTNPPPETSTGGWPRSASATGGASTPDPEESPSGPAPWRIERRRVVLGRPSPRPVPVDRAETQDEARPATDPPEGAR